jgi:hypothetical protein
MVQRQRCHGGIVVTWLQLLRISKLRMAGLLRVHWLSWQQKITVLCDGKMLPKVAQRLSRGISGIKKGLRSLVSP